MIDAMKLTALATAGSIVSVIAYLVYNVQNIDGAAKRPRVMANTGLLVSIFAAIYAISRNAQGTMSDNEIKFSMITISVGILLFLICDRFWISEVSGIFEKLRAEADRDHLTGLWNRKVLIKRFQEELSRLRRFGGSGVFIIMDVNNFKEVNDTLGHSEGDRVLRDIGNMLAKETRSTDWVARYGGDEFAILMPQVLPKAAEVAIDRIQRAMADIKRPGDIDIGLSVGIASYPEDSDQLNQLTSIADKRMYEMKNAIRKPSKRKPTEGSPQGWTKPRMQSDSEMNSETSTELRTPDIKDDIETDRSIPLILNSQANRQSQTKTFIGRGLQAILPLDSLKSNVFWLLICTFGLWVIATGFSGAVGMLDIKDLPIWILMFAGSIAGELLALDIDYRDSTQSFTFSDAFTVANLYLFSPDVSVTTVAIASVTGDMILKRAWYKTVFNAAALAISLKCANLLRVLITTLNPESALNIDIAIVTAIAVYYVINQAVMCTMVGILSGRSPWDIYNYNSQIVVFSFACLSSLGVGLSMLYRIHLFAIFLLLLPIFGVYYTYNRYRELETMTACTLGKLSEVLEKRDLFTANHSQRVATIAVKLAEKMGLSETDIRILELAGKLHDIGKVGISNDVLYKPTIFSAEEALKMQAHPAIAYEILKDVKQFRRLAGVILAHHERWDGTGYPRRMRGEDIPPLARILAVADTYDAMTSDRPYRKALDARYAIEEIVSQSGLQFDPDVVAALKTLADASIENTKNEEEATGPRIPESC